MEDMHSSTLQKGAIEQRPVLEYELVLRKWSNLHASMEFRCFVSKHKLVKKAGQKHCIENSKTITSDEKETNKPNALENNENHSF